MYFKSLLSLLRRGAGGEVLSFIKLTFLRVPHQDPEDGALG